MMSFLISFYLQWFAILWPWNIQIPNTQLSPSFTHKPCKYEVNFTQLSLELSSSLGIVVDDIHSLAWTILMADLSPDWICPRCTTPVTPSTSSTPSQWFG